MRQVGWVALVSSVVALAGCSDEPRTFVNPWGSAKPEFDWPQGKDALPAGALRLEAEQAFAVYDTEGKKAEPLAFKVIEVSSGADVTAKASFGIRDARFGKFEAAKFLPGMSSADPAGIVTVVGARVDGKVGFAYLPVVQLARSGKRRDGVSVGAAGAEPVPAKLTLGAGGSLYKADVAIVMDTTGSMGGSIADLVSSLVTKILPDLRRRIPDVAFGLVEHKDYPLSPYGDSKDFPVKIQREVTTETDTVRSALAALDASGGGDLPESQVPAMFHALTGAEIAWSSGSVPKRTPPMGRIGAIGFRPGAMPVMVLVTDIDWHEDSHAPYKAADVGAAVTREQLADAFNTVHAKFVNVTQAGFEDQAEWLSDQTKSSVPVAAFQGACGEGKCCTGVSGAARDPDADGRCRLNFLHKNGEGVSNSLINAISGLSFGTIFDVSAKLSAVEGQPDITGLVTGLTPVAAGNATIGCAAHEVKDTNSDGVADTFVGVPVTDSVCFDVTVTKNTAVAAAAAPQVVWAYLDVVGSPGQVLLDRRVVMLVVPAKS